LLAEAIAAVKACDTQTIVHAAPAAQFVRNTFTSTIWIGDKYVEKDHPNTPCVVLAVLQEKGNHRLRVLLWHTERKDAEEPEFSMPRLDNLGPVHNQDGWE